MDLLISHIKPQIHPNLESDKLKLATETQFNSNIYSDLLHRLLPSQFRSEPAPLNTCFLTSKNNQIGRLFFLDFLFKNHFRFKKKKKSQQNWSVRFGCKTKLG